MKFFYKALIIVMFAALPINCHGAGVSSDPKKLGITTLDRLNEAEEIIPELEPAQIYPKSGYKIGLTTETSATGKNIIIKHVYDETNFSLTPLYYEIFAVCTEYGDKDNYSEVKYYKWDSY